MRCIDSVSGNLIFNVEVNNVVVIRWLTAVIG